MAEPMAITKEMRESRAAHVDRIINRVNAGIERAVSQGLHECYFSCDKDSDRDTPFYQEVRERFERCGYRIKPYGYSNGVWQRAESIEW